MPPVRSAAGEASCEAGFFLNWIYYSFSGRMYIRYAVRIKKRRRFDTTGPDDLYPNLKEQEKKECQQFGIYWK